MNGIVALQQAQLYAGKMINYKTRRASVALCSPETTQAAAARDVIQATLVKVPVTTTRWRIKIANRNVLTNTALTTPVSGVGIAIGAPLTPVANTNNTYRWNGDGSAALTSIVSTFTVPTDGTAYVSPWITASNQQLVSDTQMLLRVGYTTTATGTGYSSSSANQWATIVGSGSSSHYADAVVSGLSGYTGPKASSSCALDIVIEYEFTGAARIGLFVGDSILAGTGDGDVAGTQTGSLCSENWPAQAGQLGRFCAINAGVTSAALSTAVAANYYFTRFDLATTVPDFAVMELGTNNIGATASANYASYIAVIAALRTLGIPRIFLTTLAPRNDLAGNQTTLQAATSVSATSISTGISIANASTILIGQGRTFERIVTNGAPTGTGPFTIPTPSLAIAHIIGTQVATGNEVNRQQLNDWIRQMPYGVDGVLDIDSLMASTPGSAVPDLRAMSNDGVHFLRGGNGRVGAFAAAQLGSLAT
jgi:hypothetical protein